MTAAEQRIAVTTAIADKNRPLSERLILEWKWHKDMKNAGAKLGIETSFRWALWSAIDVADENELEKLARGFADEVTAVRLYRTTWIGAKLKDENLL